LEVDIPRELDVSPLEELFPDIALKQPTSQTILMVYRSLLDHVQTIGSLNVRLEESRSENVRKEVELDQTLQEQDVRLKELEQSLSSRVAEVEHLKEENRQLCSLCGLSSPSSFPSHILLQRQSETPWKMSASVSASPTQHPLRK
jgi:hypothetical protein